MLARASPHTKVDRLRLLELVWKLEGLGRVELKERGRRRRSRAGDERIVGRRLTRLRRVGKGRRWRRLLGRSSLMLEERGDGWG